ncbi:MAG TPA: hypothetical protein PKC98_02250 [Candidatus Melainabacteria bacterium]|nr:hypothetical protein [Candidatus Melainabacteria bacterium]
MLKALRYLVATILIGTIVLPFSVLVYPILSIASALIQPYPKDSEIIASFHKNKASFILLSNMMKDNKLTDCFYEPYFHQLQTCPREDLSPDTKRKIDVLMSRISVSEVNCSKNATVFGIYTSPCLLGINDPLVITIVKSSEFTGRYSKEVSNVYDYFAEDPLKKISVYRKLDNDWYLVLRAN